MSNSSGLWKVTAVSSTSIWATGWDGLVLEWDGAAWHDRSSKLKPDGYYVQGPEALWGASPSNVWGVSERGLWHWDGVKWALTEKAGWWPTAIAGSSANDIWVVGNDGLIGHFDGSTWTRFDSPVTAHLLSVSVRAANDAWAAGLAGSLLHWDGASWKQVGPADGIGGWSDVRASADGEAWLLATDGAVYRWRGNFDYMRASRSGYGYLVQALWAFSPTDVWLVGENGLAEHWDGTSFVPVETATNAVFRDVTGAPNGDVWAVGQSLEGVAFRRAAK